MKEYPITANDTVYISGRMTGVPFWNFPLFFAIEAWLREDYGCKVLNPARTESKLGLHQYMEIDLAMVRICSIVLVLPNSESSNGTRAELEEAKNHCKTIIYLEEE